jgi:phosphate transport system permease protein
VQTNIDLEIYVDPAKVDAKDPAKGNFRAVVRDTLTNIFPQAQSPKQKTELTKILTADAPYILRDYVLAHPESIGQRVVLAVPASDPFDQINKGVIPKYQDVPDGGAPGSAPTRTVNPRFSPLQIEAFEDLEKKGLVRTPFNWGLFFNADSRFPERAGLAGAITGSFYALLVCFLLSFPIGIAAALYLEEFAPKNRLTDLIEVNINNLAAVPSVVFGLLGLAVFLGFFGLPRSAPLVGGMVLSLMTLPTIIIATRAALKAVPPSIREAALGVGASKHQVMLHHVLPVAMPGILTGTIIGMAQALGETAPLLLIGMNAFIPSVENIGLLDPATSLPTQIYSWADSPERGFVARTSAAILVLLGFLAVMNLVAIVLRHRFERKW